MRAVIVFDSLHGNTEAIANSIADGLIERSEVRILKATDAQPDELVADLIILGGPTHVHRASDVMGEFLDRLPRRSLAGVRASAFDTRYRMARWMTGSAAVVISRRLKHAGAVLIDEPQSFFVQADKPEPDSKRHHELEHLESGELERARTWGADLLSRVPVRTTSP